MNVGLRPLVPGDAAWVDAWLPDVAVTVGHDARAVASLRDREKDQRSMLLRAVERDGEPAGIVVAHAGRPKRGAGTIELVALAPGHARRGTGMRAAALVESELRGAGVKRVYAPAPAVHGIAVYFWIRLGYHPLSRHDWPCEREGVGWMMRELTE